MQTTYWVGLNFLSEFYNYKPTASENIESISFLSKTPKVSPRPSSEFPADCVLQEDKHLLNDSFKRYRLPLLEVLKLELKC